jgi:hypothetical protein
MDNGRSNHEIERTRPYIRSVFRREVGDDDPNWVLKFLVLGKMSVIRTLVEGQREGKGGLITLLWRKCTNDELVQQSDLVHG